MAGNWSLYDTEYGIIYYSNETCYPSGVEIRYPKYDAIERVDNYWSYLFKFI